MKSKSEALKGISIVSVEETVDEAMSFLPESFDLTQPGNRQIVRNWMVRVCGVAVGRNAESMVKAAESAIQEAAALAINPDYYAQRKKERDKRKAIRAIRQKDAQPKTRAEARFERMTSAEVKQ